MKTGDVEVIVDSLSFINKAGNLPFHITPGAPQAVEVSRLKHRYLDLRCDEMQFNLRFRSNAAMVIRHVLTKKFGFVEVETPTLFKQTPKVRKFRYCKSCIFHVPHMRKKRFIYLPFLQGCSSLI
jgi:aspartyl-tRNA synthetase